MSARLDGGGRADSEAFLSAHRCPEVDLLPRHKPEAGILPPGSALVDARSDSNYLDVSSTPHRHEEEDGAISDWSEEDLSLHFSPSVIISSDDEEGTFECVDITMETLVNGQEGEGPKMVPKRQIQLKKREEENPVKEMKSEVRREAAEGQDGSREASAPEALATRTRQGPDLLLRQHSMPASTASGDADSYRVYRGLIAGANQGLHVGAKTKQRLQKSFSLDETKTKMASGIIKSVLSKKMQAERGHCRGPPVQSKPTVAPNLPQAIEQQRAREGGGGGGGGGGGSEAAGGAARAPLHVVRDVRSLVRNTYSRAFSAPQTSKPLRFKAVGQGGSPPPSYQQAVGVKVHHPSRNLLGGIAKQARNQENQRDAPQRPIAQMSVGSVPIRERSQRDDVIRPGASTNSPDVGDPSRSDGAERAGAGAHEAVASLPTPEAAQSPGCPPSSRHPEATQEPSAVLGAPSQQILQPCFYTQTALPPFGPALLRHMGKVSYLQAPLNYVQNLRLLTTPEENPSGPAGSDLSRQVQSPPPRTSKDPKSKSAAATPEKPRQQEAEPGAPGAQGFLPDAANPAAPSSGALPHGPAPSHILEPPNLPCFYVDVAAQPQTKTLLDPETGQYVQVYLPAASAAPGSSVYPLGLANPAPLAVTPAPAFLSVMQLPPAIAVSPYYAPPFLPFPLGPASIHFTHTPL